MRASPTRTNGAARPAAPGLLFAAQPDQLVDPLCLLVPKLVQPPADRPIAEIAGDPRPPPGLLGAGPDGVRGRLHHGDAGEAAGAHYSAPRRRMDSTSPKGPKWREKRSSVQSSAASRLARTGAEGSRWPRSTADSVDLGMPARRATCRCA